ncbi:hypothetical protein HYV89_03435 [Candidatus Woesearchaeota archaeon]|nr:hypothetical protein [Candidatus Woesearchaeota archaeon]
MLKKISSKEKKELLKQLQEQFNFSGKLDYNFFVNQDKKIFIFNKNLDIDFSKIRVNSLGLYFANTENELRLSIEGSQLIGPHSRKNIFEIEDKQLQEWMHGRDIETENEFEGFVLIKNKDDFYGTGKYKDGKILNFIPKERRLKN